MFMRCPACNPIMLIDWEEQLIDGAIFLIATTHFHGIDAAGG